jgi:hypothetical protein
MDQDDAVTIYFYQSLATDVVESRMTAETVTVTVFDASGNQYGSPKTFTMSSLGQKLFKSQTFIPSYSWNPPAGTILSRFTYVVKGTYFDTNGATINVTGPTNSKTFDVLH